MLRMWKTGKGDAHLAGPTLPASMLCQVPILILPFLCALLMSYLFFLFDAYRCFSHSIAFQFLLKYS